MLKIIGWLSVSAILGGWFQAYDRKATLETLAPEDSERTHRAQNRLSWSDSPVMGNKYSNGKSYVS